MVAEKDEEGTEGGRGVRKTGCRGVCPWNDTGASLDAILLLTG